MNKAPLLVLFDLDGTISDPIVGISSSMNFALERYGFASRPVEDLAVFVGPPLDHAFETLTESRDRELISSLVAAYRERYTAIGYSENVLYPQIPAVLRKLSVMGVRMAVCTSKRVDYASMIVQMFGLDHHFEFVDGGDVGIEKWQQVAALLESGRIGLDTLFVGDRAVDVFASQSNAIPCAAVLWGYGSRQELEGAQPQYLLNEPPEVVRTVEGLLSEGAQREQDAK